MKKNITSFYLSVFILLSSLLFFSCGKSKNVEPKFGTIVVDKENRTIIFDAELNTDILNTRVSKLTDTREIYFLFYFKGYPWLKNYCLFHSTATLQQLQTAVSFIDWKLWDMIYTERWSPEIKIFIYLPSPSPFPQQERKSEYRELDKVLKLDHFDMRQAIFWGSPVYDPIVLSSDYKNLRCSTCQLLPLEQGLFFSGLKPIRYKFLKPLKSKNYKFKIVFYHTKH